MLHDCKRDDDDDGSPVDPTDEWEKTANVYFWGCVLMCKYNPILDAQRLPHVLHRKVSTVDELCFWRSLLA